MRLWSLLLAATPAAANASSDVSACVTVHLAKAPALGANLSAVRELQGFCYDLVASEQQVRIASASARIFEQQVFMNYVLLWMVVGLTLAGVALSALQLWTSYRLAASGKGSLAEGGDLTIEQGRVAIRSSVVGVIILVISLAFFVIFVREVYTIRTIEAPQPQSATASPGEPPPHMKEIPR